MEKYKPTVTLFYDTRVLKKSGKYPLKLIVYCRPEKKRYRTNIDLTPEEWKKVSSEKLRDENLKEIRFKINALVARAEKIMGEISPFSFRKFEGAFYENAIDLNGMTLATLFEQYISKHKSKGNIGTAISYQTAINSFSGFKRSLSLYDVTPDFLQDYEEHMIKNGKSKSTIGIYLRQLRAIFNDAISKNLISRDYYPFGKNKYIIPIGSNTKKALSSEEIRSILDYSPANKEEQRALDFWIFSYLSNGMNFCDILKLKRDNIEGRFINYIRSKTLNTKKGTNQNIMVPIHPKAQEILDRWKTTNSNSSFLFPFLKEGANASQIKYLTQDFIKATNKQMDIIRLKLGIKQKCTTYSCRHSFATTLKRKNINTEFISESLGHSSILTTSAYLASFEDKTKILNSALLTEF